MTRRHSGSLALLAAAFLACAAAAVPQTAPMAVPDPNPLMSKSPLPFQAPPFDRIKDSDYSPAIEEGMRAAARRDRRDRRRPGATDLRQHDRGHGALGRAPDARRQGLLQHGPVQHQRSAIQKIKAELAPKLSAHNGRDLPEPEALRARHRRSTTSATRSARRARPGTSSSGTTCTSCAPAPNLSDADKAALSKSERRRIAEADDRIRRQAAGRHERLRRRRRTEGRAGGPVRRRPRRGRRGGQGEEARGQVGPSAAEHDAAAAARVAREPRAPRAHPPGLAWPAATTAARTTRGRSSRALAQLRAQKAKLLGFPTYAAYVLDDQMAKTPAERREADERPRARRDGEGARRGGRASRSRSTRRGAASR